jgi:parallel beta-helix repeat protein
MTRNLLGKATKARLAPAIIAGLAAAGTGVAQAATPITTCGTTISSPGSYVLTSDLGPCGGNAINITASNVNLMLNGFTITGAPGGTGIAAYVVSNIQIQGPGLIQQFVNGIYLQSVSNSQIQQVVTAFNTYGILSQGSTGLQLQANVFAQNVGTSSGGGPSPTSTGLWLEADSNDHVQQNEVTANAYGIIVASGSGNQVQNNSVDGNGSIGIYIDSSNNNSIQNNTVFGNGTATSASPSGYGVYINGTGNGIHNNTSEGNVTDDLFDATTSPPCDTNSWHNDTFFTANQSCIQ